MSLYPQSHYGQPYPPSYTQAPPPLPGYQYPYPPQPALPPPPIYHVDPATFRRDFTNRLTELTINSRPIIQSLSMLAQDNSRFAEIVTQCLEAHIRRVPPWMKLPAFYLMDAISKNVYEPYARHFATFVVSLFLEAYHQVDANTRSKMEEMLLTWRTGSPAGKELFGVPPQIAIERGVWGDGAAAAASNTGVYSGTSQITKAQVLSELEFTLGQKERALQANPYDVASRNHVNVLHQLRKLVEAGVSQEELHQILTQLRTLMRSPVPPPPPPPPSTVVQPPPHWSQHLSYAEPSQQSTLPSIPPHQALQTYPMQQTGIKADAASVSSTSSFPSVPLGNIETLLSTLVKAGIVSANGTPQGAGATVHESDDRIDITNQEQEREASRQYRKNVLAQKIKLTNADLTRKRLNIVTYLYDRLPAQCKQCGIRFADSPAGKKRMEDHLDMHFRQNRKANQNVGRGHSRSWFVGVEDWVHDTVTDVKGKGRADGSRPLNAKAAAAADLAKRDAELRAKFVVVPPGDEAKPISCPICKETLKSEFFEDDEDWVWKNAVMKDDKIYHATCHAEALLSTSSLATRLRADLANRSRSATPEASTVASSLRSTPPRASTGLMQDKSIHLSPEHMAGTKRKVETDAFPESELDGTPPMKKLALSTVA